MTLAYVTTAEVKLVARVQHTAFDTFIETMIEAASAAVKDYLKDYSPYEAERNDDDDYIVDSNYEPEPKLDSNGNQVVKAPVKIAVIMLVVRWINALNNGEAYDMNYLPREVLALLYPLRDPAFR